MDRVNAKSLQHLLQVADVVDVISKHVALTKVGSNYVGCCPFHNETTPSFSISRGKSVYYCFGCKAKGNVLSFVMRYEHLNLVAAAEALATTYGVTLVYSQRNTEQDTAIKEVLQSALTIYRDQLSLQARNFCQARGLTSAVVAQYQLGYAQALKHDQLSQEQLITAGLVRRTEHGQCFEIFKNRLVFPIKTTRGVCIGFGGRVLGETLPKYINSHESMLFQKRSVLYGAYEMLITHPRPPEILLVEGYLDVLSLVSKGYTMVVAALGSSVSSAQAQKLLELTSKVIICFDGDQAGLAGQLAAFTQFGSLLQQQHELFFCTLPSGYDPDTYVQQYGLTAFQALLDTATHHLDYFITITHGPNIFQTLTHAQAVMHELHNPPYQLALSHKLASAYGLRAQNIIRALLNPKVRPTSPPVLSLAPNHDTSKALLLRDQALAYMLQYPQVALALLQETPQNTVLCKEHDALTSVITLLQQYPEICHGALLLTYIQQYHVEHHATCQQLIHYHFHLKEEDLTHQFRDTLLYLIRQQDLCDTKWRHLLPSTYFLPEPLVSQEPPHPLIKILKYKYLILRHQALKAEEQS